MSGRLMKPVARTLAVAVFAFAGLGALARATAAGADDRGVAESVLHDVEASPKKAAVAEMTARSHAALDRASKLRASGDEPHARIAESAARTWAEAARDVLRAVDVEEKAAAARIGATDAGAVADRERALLEEGVAQSGRLRAQLEAAERDSKEQPARTSAQADKDAGASAAPKPQPKPPVQPGGKK
jgi:hypothetical protein